MLSKSELLGENFFPIIVDKLLNAKSNFFICALSFILFSYSKTLVCQFSSFPVSSYSPCYWNISINVKYAIIFSSYNNNNKQHPLDFTVFFFFPAAVLFLFFCSKTLLESCLHLLFPMCFLIFFFLNPVKSGFSPTTALKFRSGHHIAEIVLPSFDPLLSYLISSIWHNLLILSFEPLFFLWFQYNTSSLYPPPCPPALYFWLLPLNLFC